MSQNIICWILKKHYSFSKDLKDPLHEVLPFPFLPERDIHLQNSMGFWLETVNKRPKYQAGDFDDFCSFSKQIL
jgi:hypothetical protein